MHMQSLQDLYVDQLRDLYNAENQLVKALPKLAKTANSSELKEAFENHLEETRHHVERLEQIFEKLGTKPSGKTCKAMKGLVEEGAEMIDEDAEPPVMDAGLIAAAQRVEHYEMAGYGVVRNFARILGHESAAKILQQTLDEEGAADKKQTKLADSMISTRAAQHYGA